MFIARCSLHISGCWELLCRTELFLNNRFSLFSFFTNQFSIITDDPSRGLLGLATTRHRRGDAPLPGPPPAPASRREGAKGLSDRWVSAWTCDPRDCDRNCSVCCTPLPPRQRGEGRGGEFLTEFPRTRSAASVELVAVPWKVTRLTFLEPS